MTPIDWKPGPGVPATAGRRSGTGHRRPTRVPTTADVGTSGRRRSARIERITGITAAGTAGARIEALAQIGGELRYVQSTHPWERAQARQRRHRRVGQPAHTPGELSDRADSSANQRARQPGGNPGPLLPHGLARCRGWWLARKAGRYGRALSQRGGRARPGGGVLRGVAGGLIGGAGIRRVRFRVRDAARLSSSRAAARADRRGRLRQRWSGRRSSGGRRVVLLIPRDSVGLGGGDPLRQSQHRGGVNPAAGLPVRHRHVEPAVQIGEVLGPWGAGDQGVSVIRRTVGGLRQVQDMRVQIVIESVRVGRRVAGGLLMAVDPVLADARGVLAGVIGCAADLRSHHGAQRLGERTECRRPRTAVDQRRDLLPRQRGRRRQGRGHRNRRCRNISDIPAGRRRFRAGGQVLSRRRGDDRRRVALIGGLQRPGGPGDTDPPDGPLLGRMVHEHAQRRRGGRQPGRQTHRHRVSGGGLTHRSRSCSAFGRAQADTVGRQAVRVDLNVHQRER